MENSNRGIVDFFRGATLSFAAITALAARSYRCTMSITGTYTALIAYCNASEKS